MTVAAAAVEIAAGLYAGFPWWPRAGVRCRRWYIPEALSVSIFAVFLKTALGNHFGNVQGRFDRCSFAQNARNVTLL